MQSPQSVQPLPTVVLVGRVNVGKSTLFNRLLGVPHSLVSPYPGTTRDVQEALVSWRGIAFSLIDTGGLDAGAEPTGIFKQVITHAKHAIERADLILFITDAKDGMLPSDRQIARELRRHTEKTIMVVNKADNPTLRSHASEGTRLGFGDPIAVSAINGAGTGDLLDCIVKRIITTPDRTPLLPPIPAIHLAIIGKPNVGKSTLLNAILGYERVIVSPSAHTTREPVDTPFVWNDIPMVLIDTAGIRRKARVKKGLEHAGVKRSIAVLERADVALLVIDMSLGIDDQDKQLAHFIERSHVGVIIVPNKWDLVQHADAHGPSHVPAMRMGAEKNLGATHLKYVYGKLPFLTWAPVVFASALNKYHLTAIMQTAVQTIRARGLEISPEELTIFFSAFHGQHPLPRLGETKRRPFFMYFKQIDTRPPAFELSVKTKEQFPVAYANLLEKEMRRRWDFTGTPVRIMVKTER